MRGAEVGLEDRAFWAEVRRWLKLQNQANSQMIAAIEQRYGPFGQQRKDERRPPQPAA
jgi:hypothetical protein